MISLLPEEAHGVPPQNALDLISMHAARRQFDDLWDSFLAHAAQLHAAPRAALRQLQRNLASHSEDADWQVPAIRVWLRRRIEHVPSHESRGIAGTALHALSRHSPVVDTRQQVRLTGAQLLIHLSCADYEAAARAADQLRDLLPQLSAEHQVNRAAAIRHLLAQAVDAYIGAGRLNDAELALDARGRADDEHSTRAFIHAMRGEVTAAAALLEDTTGLDVADDDASPRRCIARAAVLLENDQPIEAAALLSRLEPQHPHMTEWPFAAVVAARADTALDPIIGSEHMKRLVHRNRNLPTSRRLRHLLRSAIVDLSLAADDVPTAHRMLTEIDPEDHMLRISAARLALVTGDIEAIRDLAALIDIPGMWPRLRAQALLLLAVHLNRAGHHDDARDLLRRALAITSALGIRFIHSLIPLSELQQITTGTDIVLPPLPSIPGRLKDVLTRVQLTEREANLLNLLNTALTLREIAASEFVSLSTIKTQLRGLYRKLGVASRDEAVIVGVRRGLVSLDSLDG